MSALPRRPLVNAAVILGVGLFALGAGPSIPALRKAGLKLVEQLALRLDPTPSAFTGDASPVEPWQRWKSKSAPPREPVALLSIDPDEGGWFSASPPAPVDCAVMFKRLRDAGHRSIGCGYLMAWEDADPLAMIALRKQLDRFDTAVLGLPLSRGAAGEPLPSAFLRLSVELDEVEGDPSSLPQVNKVAAPRAELGGERSLAGFTVLENERPSGDGRQPLLARWGDRIIFALPLASEIGALGIDPSEVKIALGREIRLGLDGPVVPIDSFGRTAPTPAVGATDTPAWKLVSEDRPVPPATSPLLIRDGRPALPQAEDRWSQDLPGLAEAIRSAPRYERPLTLQRLPALGELALVLVMGFFAAWATWIRGFFWRILVVLMAAAFAGELLYLLSAHRNLWLPPLPIAGMCGASLLLSLYLEKSGKTQAAVNPRPWESPDFQPPVRPAELEPAPPTRPRPAPVPAWAPAPIPIPAPAPLPARPLTRVKFVDGAVVLPESARALWGRPDEVPPAPVAVVEAPAPPADEEEPPVPEPASVVEEESFVPEPAPVVEEESLVPEPAAVVEEEPPVPEPAAVVEEEPSVEEPAPVVEEEPPVEEPAPVVEEESPVEEPAPVVEEESPVEEPAPVEEEEPPVEEPAPVEKEEPLSPEPAVEEATPPEPTPEPPPPEEGPALAPAPIAKKADAKKPPPPTKKPSKKRRKKR